MKTISIALALLIASPAWAARPRLDFPTRPKVNTAVLFENETPICQVDLGERSELAPASLEVDVNEGASAMALPSCDSGQVVTARMLSARSETREAAFPVIAGGTAVACVVLVGVGVAHVAGAMNGLVGGGAASAAIGALTSSIGTNLMRSTGAGWPWTLAIACYAGGGSLALGYYHLRGHGHGSATEPK